MHCTGASFKVFIWVDGGIVPPRPLQFDSLGREGGKMLIFSQKMEIMLIKLDFSFHSGPNPRRKLFSGGGIMVFAKLFFFASDSI